MLIAIGALVLMIVSLGGIAVPIRAHFLAVSDESSLIAVLGLLGLAGFVLGVVTGFIAQPREAKIDTVAS